MTTNTSQVSDKQLIDKYIAGDNKCLEVLINRHRQKVYTYILMMVRDSSCADDIFQDTFIKVINTLKLGYYKEEGKFVQWVMRISHNLIIDHFRKNKKMQTVEAYNDDYDIFDLISEPTASIEEQLVTKQIHADVRNLINYLPDEQKEVLIMRHYEDMSFKDIAEQTSVSINTALGRMRYALINLRKLIAENKIELNA